MVIELFTEIIYIISYITKIDIGYLVTIQTWLGCTYLYTTSKTGRYRYIDSPESRSKRYFPHAHACGYAYIVNIFRFTINI